MKQKPEQGLEHVLHDFILDGFSPRFGQVQSNLPTNACWQKIKSAGTELWLDTGNIDEISKYWTQEFTAVTTNNTLLNKEVQTGRYDSLIRKTAEILDKYDLDDRQRKLEFAFALNAYHALRLVEIFDAYVSVEEHTDLAGDADLAVAYARRYYAICPQRFIVKIPFTPAGLLATRIVSGEQIPVNHTLGFSARQNYIIGRIGRPRFVNVFLGRLNSFVADNELGDGQYVGEKAALASCSVIRELCRTHSIPSRQIAASIRDGQQVLNLAGIDVMTMPGKAAGQFLDMNIPQEQITDHTGYDYEPGVTDKASIEKYRLDTLWDVPDKLHKCVDKLEKENLDTFVPDDIIDFFHENDCGDIMVRWSEKEFKMSMKEGKIPRVTNWKKPLMEKTVGLDSLMNLAGLCSFTADQNTMDNRVESVLSKTKE